MDNNEIREDILEYFRNSIEFKEIEERPFLRRVLLEVERDTQIGREYYQRMQGFYDQHIFSSGASVDESPIELLCESLDSFIVDWDFLYKDLKIIECRCNENG